MRRVIKACPETLYLMLGETHPLVRHNEGETYRDSLKAIVTRFGLEEHVRFVNRYLDFDELMMYLHATDVYLTPYLNPEQIASGTLAYAMGIGKAIVSTPYLYAQELLADRRGLLVPFRDANAMADSVIVLLSDAMLRGEIERSAYRWGRRMTWPNVVLAHGRLLRDVAGEPDRRIAPSVRWTTPSESRAAYDKPPPPMVLSG
jgi:glycosyltransferase involved in cell wall biosynthesis